MGHYVRLLSPGDGIPSVDALRSALKQHGRSETIAIDAGKPQDWTQLLLAHADGSEIAAIERNAVLPGELGAEEIEEFLDEINRAKPESAVRWLRAYLPRVKCIYAFQILSGARTKDGWGSIDVIRRRIKSSAGGITQADWEGFSNEDDYHILWQFFDYVEGQRWMAVLEGDVWVPFQMDLGDRKHRAAFLRGEIPTGVAPARPGTEPRRSADATIGARPCTNPPH
jgi:hypothetical protein